MNAEKILSIYPNKIPVIVSKDAKCKDLENLEKCKFLVSHDMTLGQFIYIIRKNLKLDSKKAIFLFIDNKYIESTSKNFDEIYEKHKSDDSYLYLSYTTENTFG